MQAGLCLDKRSISTIPAVAAAGDLAHRLAETGMIPVPSPTRPAAPRNPRESQAAGQHLSNPRISHGPDLQPWRIPARMVGEAATPGLGTVTPAAHVAPVARRPSHADFYPGTAILPHESQVGLKPGAPSGKRLRRSIGAVRDAGTTSPPRFCGDLRVW